MLERALAVLAFSVLLAMLIAQYRFLAVIQIDPYSPVRSDFLPFYTTARMLLEGYGSQMYQVDAQQWWQNLIGGTGLGEVYLNYHPPFENLLFLPLTLLPLRFAYWVWNAASLAMVTASIWMLLGMVRPASELWQGVRVMMALSFIPVVRLLALGQDSAMLLLIVTLAIRDLRQGRDGRAGAVLGLGLFRFQLLLLPALYLAVRRRWAALRALTLVRVVQVLVSLLLVGWQGARDYAHLVLDAATFDNSHGIFPAMMYNIKALLVISGLQGSIWLWPTLLLVSTALVGLLLVVSRGPWDPASPRFVLHLAVLILVTVLTSPHLYLYDLVLLIVPGMLLYDATMPVAGVGLARWLRCLVPMVYLGLLASFVWSARVNFPIGACVLLVALMLLVWEGFFVVRAATPAPGRRL